MRDTAMSRSFAHAIPKASALMARRPPSTQQECPPSQATFCVCLPGMRGFLRIIGMGFACGALSCTEPFEPGTGGAIDTSQSSIATTVGPGTGARSSSDAASSSPSSSANSSGASSGSAGSLYFDEVLADMPLVYYRLGEVASPALDEGPMGLHAAYLGGVALQQPGAVADDFCVHFDGVDGHISLGDALDFPMLAKFSLETWIRPDRFASGYMTLVGKTSRANQTLNGYFLYYRNDQVAFQRVVADAREETDLVPLPPGFVHLVATYDGMDLRLYVNGGLAASIASSGNLENNSGPFLIGGDPYFSEFFSGWMDEVAVYDYVLEADRVFAHFTAAK